MHVCILTTGFPRFRGDLFGAFVLEMARALVAQGTQVTVVAPHEKGIARHEKVEGISVHRFRYFLPVAGQRVAYDGGIPTNIRSSWFTRVQIPLFLLAFAWAARRQGKHCDLYHCQWTTTAAVAWLANLGRRRPILLSVRGSDMKLSDHPMGERINRWLVQRADAVTAVSEQISQRLGDHGVGNRTQVVANGVSDRFQPRNRQEARRSVNLPADVILCLFVGMLVPVKGLDVFVDAVAEVGDKRVLCVLVGDGPERQVLEERVAAAGLSDGFLFVGACSSDDVPRWMDACDFLVLPSLSEGRPNVVLEAHASGRATLATEVGGTGELIDHEETGLLVPASDVGALAGALRQLIDDPNGRERLGRAARERLLERQLTWEGTASTMRRLYDRLCGEEPCVASPAA
ncbi:MAG: glycosyltransferase [Candidatus Latescibacterota bacterium]|nr:glycosyltransferase [Candidatus Latescibacterota bacterium]